MPYSDVGPGGIQGEPFDEDTVDDLYPRLTVLELDDEEGEDNWDNMPGGWELPRSKGRKESEFSTALETSFSKG